MIRRLLICTFILLTAIANAQTNKISGNVKDATTGECLMGVNVILVGTSVGTSTDLDGNFSIEAPANGTLSFSFIGYNETKEKINGRHSINVILSEKSELMDEVVVVGYTSQKKNNVLGAVSKVGTKELTAIPVATTEQALQGRIAGVQVSSATGAPGDDVSIRIRGVGSISSDNAPLYIIDGIPSSNGLSGISATDIENITVLKDASSAAIYGSRANNGVVLVTTKSGKKGKATITYNGTVGLQSHGKLIKMANTAEYVNIYNEATNADNIGTTIRRKNLEGDYLNGLADVDHVASIFQTAPIHSHEISISGGNDKTTYLMSGSFLDQEGIINHSGYKKASLRANIASDVKEWLKVGMIVNGALSNRKSVSSSGDGYGNDQGGSVVRYAMFRNPAIPIKDSEGNYIDKPSTYFGESVYDAFFGDGYNPVGLAENTDRRRRVETLFYKVFANFKLPYNLNLNTNYGIDYTNSSNRIYNKVWGDDNRINNPNSLAVSNNREFDWTFNTVLSYNKTFAEVHNLSAMAGFEAIRETGITVDNSDQDFAVWDKNLIYIGGGNGKKVSSESEWASTLASFFAQLNYDYNNRFYLSGTIRRDGSSKFYGDNKWGTFYSVSGGWNIEKEAFMSSVDIINKLKLRAGYGAIGNQNIGLYAYSDRYTPNYNYNFGGTSNNGYAQTILGNPYLKWETSKQFNVGIDLEMWRGALNFSADFYNKITSDMLVESPVPPSIGNVSPSWMNDGKVLNRGVDIELGYHHNFKDGRFDITLNGGFLHNEVLELNAPIIGGRVDNGVYATKTEVGYPIGSFFMYEMDGIFQNDAEIITSAYQGNSIQPGDVKFKNQNDDNVIDANDRVHVGSAIPTFTTGINMSGEYKGFDLNLFFQGAFGQKIYNQILTDSEGFYRGFNVTKRYYDNHWTGEGSTNTYPRASWKAKSNNARVSTRFLEDGSYMRLKNLQLGYTFKTNNWGIDRLRVYLAATNLFTLTKYSGFDPEMTTSANSTSEGDRASGIDWGTYPVSRTYSFGVNLTF